MVEDKNFYCYRDNLKIVGRLFLPNNSDERLLTPIILSHGFLANMSMCFNDAKFLAKNGYACFCFDFNGGGLFSKSDGKTTKMSVLTEANDLQAVVEYISLLDYINIEKLILIGYSQGGLVSTLLANKLQEKIKCLILQYPAFCIPDDAKSGHMMFAKFDPHNIPEKIDCGPMKLGKCYVDDVINLSYPEDIIKYKGNVLLFHGDKDKTVNLNYSIKANEEFKKLGSNIVFKIIKNGKHLFRKKCQIKEVQKDMLSFLNTI